MRWIYLAISLIGAMGMLHFYQNVSMNWIEDILNAICMTWGAALTAYGFTKWQEMYKCK